jgi:hypothetical protein
MNFVTRLETPAGLVGNGKNGEFIDLASDEHLKDFHGYPPILEKSPNVYLEAVASPDVTRFFEVVGYPCGILRARSGILRARSRYVLAVDLISVTRPSEELLRSIRKTARRLFAGDFATAVFAGGAGACGVGQVCSSPEKVKTTVLTARELLAEVDSETRRLFDLSVSTDVQRISSHISMIDWLALTINHMISPQESEYLRDVSNIISARLSRDLEASEKRRCRDLLERLLTKK